MLVLLLFFSHFSDSDLSLLSHVGKCHDQFFLFNKIAKLSHGKFQNKIHSTKIELWALNQLTSLIYLLNSQISIFILFFVHHWQQLKKCQKKNQLIYVCQQHQEIAEHVNQMQSATIISWILTLSHTHFFLTMH